MMKRPRIIADDNIPFLKGMLEPYADIKYLKGSAIKNSDLINTDALIIRTRTFCNEELLTNSSVKHISSATIGFDHIDISYCKQNNIEWTNAPGCNAASVEQYIISSLFVLTKKLNFELKGKTLGIIGIGNVGSKVAHSARLLGMRLLLCDPPRQRRENSTEFVSLKTIQENADIITFHVPLIQEGIDKTRKLIDADFINGLKKQTILINTSRGDIIDEEAFETAINRNAFKATVLDVWENEPHINLDLMKKATIATPHIAGYSVDGKLKGTEMSIASISKALGLGLKKIEVQNIPPPPNPFLAIECSSKSPETILSELYLSTYNVEDDSIRLKSDPENFEKHRSDYPVRREPKAFKLKLSKHCSNELIEITKGLGFNFTDS